MDAGQAAATPWISPAMQTALFGLIGVVVGALLTIARDWLFKWRSEKKDAQFLAVQVVGQLDRLIARCADVACDNGREGEPDEHGYAKAQTTIPTFEPERLSVVWTSLPVDLMYAILDLAYQAELAGQAASAALDYDSPPDFSEYFEERQLQFATLGMHAAGVAARLREHANLPTRSVGAWDPVATMNKRQSTILEHRARAAAVPFPFVPPAVAAK